MTRFTDFDEARAGGRVVLAWRHQLIDPDGGLIATTDVSEADEGTIVWGAELRPLAFNADRVSQRTATMTVPASDPRLVPHRVGTLLHPDTGNRVRLQAGLVIDGEPAYQTQATLLASQVGADYQSGVTVLDVALVDMLRPLRSEMEAAFLFDSGETVEAVVGRLCAQVMSGYTIAPTGFTTPSGSIEQGSKRDALVIELLEGCGHEITTDPDGNVFSRLILPSSGGDGERWLYGAGPGRIPVHTCQRVWTVRTPQGWRVEGGSFQNQEQPITTTVFDTDPTSEGFYTPGGPSQIRTSRYPFVTTVRQAVQAAYAQLRRHGVGPMTVTFTTVPNPGIRENDLIDLELDELSASGIYRVMGFSLPLQVDGMMQVTARQVYDPALNYRPPAEPNGSCLLEFSDDFNRANQNLEHLEAGEAGSPAWTEHGYSWGVVGNQAIQRYAGSWSFAMVNTPICTTDQYAAIRIGYQPAGHGMGPMVRSSGHHDGYFANVSSTGFIQLELWMNGGLAAVLGSGQYSAGNIPLGTWIYLTAIGRNITVDVGSETVIALTDDRCIGAHIGMQALGDWTGNSPAVDEFVGGEA